MAGNGRLDGGQRAFRRLAAQHFAVHDQHRRQAATAQAAGRVEAEVAVGRGVAGLDAVGVLQRGDDLGRSLDVAGRAHADDAVVFALRLEGKEVVEGGDAVDPTRRQLQLPRDVEQQVFLQETEGLLGGVQDLDQGILLKAEALQRAVDQRETRVAAGVLGSRGVAQRSRAGCLHADISFASLTMKQSFSWLKTPWS